MRIVHLSSVRRAGDVAVFNRACRALASAGHEVSYIVPGDTDRVSEKVRILAIPEPGPRRLQRMLCTTWHAYRRAVRTAADLYYVHDPELLPAALLLRLRGARVIYYAHEDAPRDVLSRHYLPGMLRSPIARLVEYVENSICPRLTAVVAATDTIAARMRSLNARCVTVYNYPHLEDYCETAMTWDERPCNVIYVGCISVARGVEEILEALALLPDSSPARLVLAGRFSPPSLAEKMKQHRGWRRVHWLGAVEPSHVPRLLNAARAGLVLYHAEPNHVAAEPYKLFEYMAAGIPVIASNFPHWRNLLSKARCGMVVDPRNPAQIAQAITTLVADSTLAAELGEQGHRFARRQCSGQRETAKLHELAERVMRVS